MSDDFVISVHALERFEERFPGLMEWEHTLVETEDGLLVHDPDAPECRGCNAAGQFMYREAMDAIDAGRVSNIAPLELANYDLSRWGPGKARVAWEPTKTRGYVLVETTDGLMIATVLVGLTTQEARSRLYVTDKNR